jgi:type IV pilus assembly protein PilA
VQAESIEQVSSMGLQGERFGRQNPKGETTMRKIMNRKGGFTLIELMIVVAIIGILAAIAIPNFLRFQLKAKSSEGKTNLAAIRTAEESYYAEFNNYVSADVSPAVTPNNGKQNFVPSSGFSTLGWSPEGDVFFNYGVKTTAPPVQSDFFASAGADIDGNGTGQIWGYVSEGGVGPVATSHDHLVPPNTCTSVQVSAVETVSPCTAAAGNSVF